MSLRTRGITQAKGQCREEDCRYRLALLTSDAHQVRKSADRPVRKGSELRLPQIQESWRHAGHIPDSLDPAAWTRMNIMDASGQVQVQSDDERGGRAGGTV